MTEEMNTTEITVYIMETDEDGNEVGEQMVDLVPYLDSLSADERQAIVNYDYRPLDKRIVADGIADENAYVDIERDQRDAMIEYMS